MIVTIAMSRRNRVTFSRAERSLVVRYCPYSKRGVPGLSRDAQRNVRLPGITSSDADWDLAFDSLIVCFSRFVREQAADFDLAHEGPLRGQGYRI